MLVMSEKETPLWFASLGQSLFAKCDCVYNTRKLICSNLILPNILLRSTGYPEVDRKMVM